MKGNIFITAFCIKSKVQHERFFFRCCTNTAEMSNDDSYHVMLDVTPKLSISAVFLTKEFHFIYIKRNLGNSFPIVHMIYKNYNNVNNTF